MPAQAPPRGRALKASSSQNDTPGKGASSQKEIPRKGSRSRQETPAKGSSSKSSQSGQNGNSQDGKPKGNAPTLKNVYAAANYIREVLLRTEGIKTYPINGFALHVICGLEFKEHHDVELVANSKDLSQIEKLLKEEKHLQKIQIHHRSKEDVERGRAMGKEDLTVDVLTGPDVGGFVYMAAMTVKIHPNTTVLIGDAIKPDRNRSYLEVVTAHKDYYDFVETLGLTYSIGMLVPQHINYVPTKKGSLTSPALKALRDIFYEMMDEEVLKRHSVAYTHRELLKDSKAEPNKNTSQRQRSPSPESLKRKEIVTKEYKNLKTVKEERVDSLRRFGADINDTKHHFFMRLYKEYYDKVMSKMESTDKSQKLAFHKKSRAKVFYYIESLKERPGEEALPVMPRFNPRAEGLYNCAELLINMCNFEINMLFESGKRLRELRSRKVPDAKKEKDELSDKINDCHKQLHVQWKSVLEIRKAMGDYLDPAYLAIHPANNGLRDSQECVELMMKEWLRWIRSSEIKIEQSTGVKAKMFLDNMLEANKYFPEEVLDRNMHKRLMTEGKPEPKYKFEVVDDYFKALSGVEMEDKVCWNVIYKIWRRDMRLDPIVPPVKDKGEQSEHRKKVDKVKDAVHHLAAEVTHHTVAKLPHRGYRQIKEAATPSTVSASQTPKKGESSAPPNSGGSTSAGPQPRRRKSRSPSAKKPAQKSSKYGDDVHGDTDRLL